MSKDIPFFELFTALQSLPELRMWFAGAVVNRACFDKGDMSAALKLTLRSPLPEGALQKLKDALRESYQFSRV